MHKKRPKYLFILMAGFVTCVCILAFGIRKAEGDRQFIPDIQETSFQLAGKLTFEEYKPTGDQSIGIVEVDLTNLNKKRLGKGKFPWRHPNGNIVFTEECGKEVNRFAMLENSGKLTVITPCSSNITNPGVLSTRYEFGRLSPDKSLLAVEARYFLNDQFHYSTIIFKDGKMIKSFDGYAAPEWLPDSKLILSADGLYITSIESEPLKIDDGRLSSGTNNSDFDPNSQRIAFEWNQQIWIMDLNGSHLKEIAYGTDEYVFPAWSPDGKYLAFLARESMSPIDYHRGVYIIEVATGKHQFIKLKEQLGGIYGNTLQGPLSWTE